MGPMDLNLIAKDRLPIDGYLTPVIIIMQEGTCKLSCFDLCSK